MRYKMQFLQLKFAQSIAIFASISIFLLFLSANFCQTQEVIDRNSIDLLDSYLQNALGSTKLAETCENCQFTLDQVDEIRANLRKAIESLSATNGNEINAKLFALYKNLLEATNSCNENSIDFLAKLNALSTSGSAELLSPTIKLARSLVVNCWQHYLIELPRKTVRNFEKASQNSIESLIIIANQLWSRDRKRQQEQDAERRKSRPMSGNIKIEETEGKQIDEEEEVDILDPLKKLRNLNGASEATIIERLANVNLDNNFNRQEFALTLNSLANLAMPELSDNPKSSQTLIKLRSFYESLLKQPCQDIIERMRLELTQAQPLLMQAKSFGLELKPTAGNELTRMATNNSKLSFALQLYRICRSWKSQQDEIFKRLTKMR